MWKFSLFFLRRSDAIYTDLFSDSEWNEFSKIYSIFISSFSTFLFAESKRGKWQENVRNVNIFFVKKFSEVVET